MSAGCDDAGSLPPAPPEQGASRLDPELEAAFAREPLQSVIVNFREPELREKGRAAKSAAIRRLQDELLSLQGFAMELSHRYQNVPALAARMSRAEAIRVLAQPNVESILLDGAGKGFLKEAMAGTGGDMVQSIHGLTGKGVRVAVLDTGIATTHPDLMDSVVGQRCYTRNACPPNRSAQGMSAEDDHGHGTHVEGVIASNGTIAPRGFAPDAEIVALKVNDQNNAGMESDWVAGLDYIYQNLATLKVKVVNLSLGTTATHPTSAECDSRHPAMLRAINNLVEAGVVVFAASGNSGLTAALPAPACLTPNITVGAIYDAKLGHQPPGANTYYERWGGMFARCGDDATEYDQVTCFSNSTSQVDLVAPGAPITSTAPRNRTDTYWGTSQASPVAAGVAALMLECNPALTPAEIRKAMVDTGVPVVDKKNGLTFPSLRALAAVRAACPSLGAAPGGQDAGASASADAGARGVDAGERDAGVNRPSPGGADASSSRRDSGLSVDIDEATDGDEPTPGDDDDDDDDDSADDDEGDGDDDAPSDDDAPGKGRGQGGGDGGCSVRVAGPLPSAELLVYGGALFGLVLRHRRRRG